MKRSAKKLRLSRDTVQRLDLVAGGLPNGITTMNHTVIQPGTQLTDFPCNVPVYTYPFDETCGSCVCGG